MPNETAPEVGTQEAPPGSPPMVRSESGLWEPGTPGQNIQVNPDIRFSNIGNTKFEGMTLAAAPAQSPAETVQPAEAAPAAPRPIPVTEAAPEAPQPLETPAEAEQAADPNAEIRQMFNQMMERMQAQMDLMSRVIEQQTQILTQQSQIIEMLANQRRPSEQETEEEAPEEIMTELGPMVWDPERKIYRQPEIEEGGQEPGEPPAEADEAVATGVENEADEPDWKQKLRQRWETVRNSVRRSNGDTTVATTEKVEKGRRRRSKRLLGAFAVLAAAGALIWGLSEIGDDDDKGKKPIGLDREQPALESSQTEVLYGDEGEKPGGVELPKGWAETKAESGRHTILDASGNIILEVGKSYDELGGRTLESITQTDHDLSKDAIKVLEGKGLKVKQGGYEWYLPDGTRGGIRHKSEVLIP